MKIFSNDGKEFSSVESCMKYENSKSEMEVAKRLQDIVELREREKKIEDQMADLIDAFLNDFPNYAEQLFEVFGEDDDEDEDEDCDGCENIDDCIVEAAVELIADLEKLKSLVEALD